MKLRKKVLPLYLSILLLMPLLAAGQKPYVTALRCEYLSNPLGIGSTAPRLSWQVKHPQAGGTFSAYQIMVASSPQWLAQNRPDLWDSGRQAANRLPYATYAGKELTSRERYYWKVRIWDAAGNASDWSETAHWEMALPDSSMWQAKWIRHPAFTDGQNEAKPAPYFRKDFRLQSLPEKGRAYVTGLGYFELYINGQKVGDHVLDPVKTRYDKSVRYLTHDITPYLRKGSNTVGMVLGTGWYNHFAQAVWGFNTAPWRAYPEARCQLEIRESNGQTLTVASDASWQTNQGPIRFDGIRNGETYDARLEMPDWNRPYFNATGWQQAVVSEGPMGELRPQLIQPIREAKTIKPVSVTEITPNVWVFDLGQNIAGYCRLKVSGPRGTEVSLKMGEKLYPDGRVEQKQILRFLRSGEAQTDRYILKGMGEEVWQPRFVYHGFQYVEVRGLPAPPTLETITGVVVHSDFDRAGHFASSDPLLNRTQQNMEWSFVGNYHGLPTDCPHREKIGWTGDAQLVAETGLFYFDVERAYLKWLDDFVEEQRPSGDLPGVIPTSGWGYNRGKDPETRPLGYGPQWEGAVVQITWDLYRFTADTAILERYYPTLKKYIDFLISKAEGHTLNFGIDDHKPVVTKTEGDILASGYLVGFSEILGKIAQAIGKGDAAKYYTDYSQKAKVGFNKKYFNKRKATYGNGGQTSLALALYFDLVPEDKKDAVLQNLIAQIEAHDDHFDVGVVGLKFLFNVLREYGHNELLYRMVAQEDLPGFGYWLKQGANTLWQDWDGSMSHNHIMFGTVNEWFFEGLAGLQLDERQPGFAHFICAPNPIPQLNWASASHNSPFGQIAVQWHKAEGKTEYRLQVPPGSRATVQLPFAEGQILRYQQQPTSDFEQQEGRAHITVGSGLHHWTVE